LFWFWFLFSFLFSILFFFDGDDDDDGGGSRSSHLLRPSFLFRFLFSRSAYARADRSPWANG
jgi:hypothetical protein